MRAYRSKRARVALEFGKAGSYQRVLATRYNRSGAVRECSPRDIRYRFYLYAMLVISNIIVKYNVTLK